VAKLCMWQVRAIDSRDIRYEVFLQKLIFSIFPIILLNIKKSDYYV
jgi:hypothetical protein